MAEHLPVHTRRVTSLSENGHTSSRTVLSNPYEPICLCMLLKRNEQEWSPSSACARNPTPQKVRMENARTMSVFNR